MRQRRRTIMNPVVRKMLTATTILSAILIAVVFATGSTFGQRCAAAYPNDPTQTEDCVERLSRGGGM